MSSSSSRINKSKLKMKSHKKLSDISASRQSFINKHVQESPMSVDVDWAGLHEDLLYSIGNQVTTIESYERFAMVCKSWNKAATKDKYHLIQKSVESPWLLLTAEKENSGMLELFNVSTGLIHNIFLPEASGKFILPYRDCLLIIGEDRKYASLLHLVSRVEIVLPNLNTLHSVDLPFVWSDDLISINKFVLIVNSSNPPSEFIVVVIWKRPRRGVQGLAFCKPGDVAWTVFGEEYYLGLSHGFDDIIYYDNMLYAVTSIGEVARFDFTTPPNPAPPCEQVFFFTPSHSLTRQHGFYLIPWLYESTFLILKTKPGFRREMGFRGTKGYMVYKVNIEDGSSVIITDLGNMALFVGRNSSFMVECSVINNCEPNCIYFSDFQCIHKYTLNEEYGKDNGIYRMEQGKAEPLLGKEIELSKITPSSWFGPREIY